MFETIPVIPATHAAYLVIGIALTVWVARTLRRHGRVFLAKGCKGNEALVDSLSHMLSVGFYLLHVGLLLLALRLGGHATGLVSAIELLSTKIGLVLIILAMSHFGHLLLYARIHGKPRPTASYTNAHVPVDAVEVV